MDLSQRTGTSIAGARRECQLDLARRGAKSRDHAGSTEAFTAGVSPLRPRYSTPDWVLMLNIRLQPRLSTVVSLAV
jgi:hypothetical protein